MKYEKFAFYGYIILFIIHLYYLYKNLNQNNFIIFGSLLITVGFFFAAYEMYNNLLNKPRSIISKSHLIVGSFRLLSFILPINSHVKSTDIFGLIGNFILINSNFGYQEIANTCLTIFFSLNTYRNISKNQILDNIRGIGSGLVLLYYIKRTIDNWYDKKEKLL